jgi:predicted phosphodiesterase
MKKLLIISAILILTPLFCKAENFCLIADIHNGSGTRERSDNNITYPKYGNRYFKEALKRAKANKVDACIILGDNTNTGKSNDAKQLAGTAKKSGVKTIFIRGNHDSSKSQKYLSNKTNYYVDIVNVRIIVLDSTAANPNGNGGVSAANIRFYEEATKTEKKIILAMHHPPFDRGTHEWNPSYDWIGEKPDVILGGHFHKEFKKGKFWSVPALTLKKNLEMRYISL